MKQIKIWKSIFVLTFLFICSGNPIYSTTTEILQRRMKQSNKVIRQRDLSGLVRNLNEVCPYINGDTRFDKFHVIADDYVAIYITYIGDDVPFDAYSDEELAALDLTNSKEAMVSVINSNAWSPLREYNPTFVFHYKDTNGRNLFQLKIELSDYQNNKGTANQSKRKKLQEMVNSLNKTCPMIIKSAVYEKIELLDNDEVEIFITYKKDTPLSKYSDKQLRVLDESAKKMLLPHIQSDSWAILRSYGATFVMSYRDKNGRELFRVKLHPENYNN